VDTLACYARVTHSRQCYNYNIMNCPVAMATLRDNFRLQILTCLL